MISDRTAAGSFDHAAFNSARSGSAGEESAEFAVVGA
jgi:hypothetical protein